MLNKSKGIQIFAIFLLWILFGFNFDNADRSVYESRIKLYYILDIKTEPIYSALMEFFAVHNLSTQFLYIFTATLFLLIIWVIGKLSKNFGLALAGYMIANFFMDVVQLRFSFALIFAYIGIWFYLKEPNIIKASIIYTLCIITSACIHISCVIYLIFLLVRVLNTNKIIWVLFACVFLSVLSLYLVRHFGYLYNSLDIFNEKIEQVHSIAEDRYSIRAIIRRICFISLIIGFYIYSYKNLFLKIKPSQSEIDTSIANNMLRINILSCSLLPLLFISADFHRCFYALYIYNLTVISRWITQDNKFVMTLSVIVLSFLLLYSLSLGSNANSVFFAVLNNNLIF